jgi:hypothetical protein
VEEWRNMGEVTYVKRDKDEKRDGWRGGAGGTAVRSVKCGPCSMDSSAVRFS